MSDAVIVFARYPHPGRVKTRLAASIGDEAAAAFYKACAEHLYGELANLPVSTNLFLYCAEVGEIERVRAWAGERFVVRAQQGDDIGARMERAFTEIFTEGATAAVVVGTDIPDLGASHIIDALRLLHVHDVVLGPAKDGGYYLVGMKRLHHVFDGIAWGSNTVAHDTRVKIIRKNLSLAQLEELEDVDSPNERFLIARPPHRC